MKKFFNNILSKRETILWIFILVGIGYAIRSHFGALLGGNF